MSLELCILASGSSGNCSVVRGATGAMLIDLGIGPRVTQQRLNGTGVRLDDVSAVCLTHLDRDHFNPAWTPTLVRRGIAVHCDACCVDQLVRLAGPDIEPLVRPFDAYNADADDATFEPLPGVRVRPIPLSHDAEGSHAFVIDGFGCRIGFATDLGRATRELVARFGERPGLDVLAIESNYDPAMQRSSGRPWFLQERIMGGGGHLSNEQAFDAVRQVLDRLPGRPPVHVVLLHRSRQCNCPKVVRALFESDRRLAGRVTLAEQYSRTDWLRVTPRAPLVGEQLSLQFG